METITFKEYQDKIIDLYKRTSIFFDAQNIDWWLHSGTLLAIKRESKLILDWDDDVDLMVPFIQWKNSLESIDNFCKENNFIYFDLTGKDIQYLSYCPFAQIFSGTYYNVIFDDGNKFTMMPFIDVFFAASNSLFTDDEWKKYSRKFPLRWLYSRKFNKYPYGENNKLLKFLINTISWPVSFFLNQEKNESFFKKPYLSSSLGELRRSDFWSSRDIIYNLENGFERYQIDGVTVVTNINWEHELCSSYGKDWAIPKKRKMHFQMKKKNIYNMYRDNVLLNSKI